MVMKGYSTFPKLADRSISIICSLMSHQDSLPLYLFYIRLQVCNTRLYTQKRDKNHPFQKRVFPDCVPKVVVWHTFEDKGIVKYPFTAIIPVYIPTGSGYTC